MQNKAISSWAIAEEFVKEDDWLNFAANRFYYALYQAACWRNDQLEAPLVRDFENETAHDFAKRIVREVLNESIQVRVFTIFRGLRIKADYKSADVTRNDLRAYEIMQAGQLFEKLIEVEE